MSGRRILPVRSRAAYRVAAVLGALLVPVSAAADMATTWSEAFELCRAHMETGAPIAHEGYVLAPEAERLALAIAPFERKQGQRTIRFPGRPAPEVLIYLPGGLLAIALTPTQCAVQVNTGQRLTQSDKQVLIQRYKADRDALVAAGTHEVLIEDVPRTVQQFAHRALQRNAFGECTVSRVMWNMKFITGMTEILSDRECDLPSRGAEG